MLTPIEIYECPVCNKEFESIWDARECVGSHLEPTKKFKCSICGLIKAHPHCCTIDSVMKELEVLEEALAHNKGTAVEKSFEEFYEGHKAMLLHDLELLKKEAL